MIYYIAGENFAVGNFGILDGNNAVVKPKPRKPLGLVTDPIPSKDTVKILGVAAEPIPRGSVIRVDESGFMRIHKYPERNHEQDN